VGFVADINACGIGMDHFQVVIFALELPHDLPPLLAVHLVPMPPLARSGWLPFSALLIFHSNPLLLNSTGLGPVGESFTISPSGSGLSPFQDNAATISTIAKTRSHA